MFHFKHLSYHNFTSRPQVSDDEDEIQIWPEAVKIIKNKSGYVTMGGPRAWWLGRN